MYSNLPCTHEPLSASVQRCCDTRNRLLAPLSEPKRRAFAEYDEYSKAEKAYEKAVDAAAQAFHIAMPEPTSRRAIKAFISAVTHGMAIGAVDSDDAKQFLYAARIAVSALGKQKPEKRTKPGVESADLFPAAPTADSGLAA